MFQVTYEAWRAYRERLPEDLSAQHAFVCADVDRRLRELTWVIEQVRLAYETHAAALKEATAREDEFNSPLNIELEEWREDLMATITEMSTRMRVHTEYFYWSAGRIRQGLRQLPGLKKFDVVGSRDVRNRVMEHPETYDSWDAGMAAMVGGSMMTSPTEWVILMRPPEIHLGTHVADAGLRTNAEEFRDSLENTLRKCLSQRDSR